MNGGPLSVEDVTQLVKRAVTRSEELRNVFVEGEVSNYSSPASGHLYFSLKDAKSKLKCVCFKFNRSRIDTQISNGMVVVAHGKVDIYGGDSAYQLYVDGIEPGGLGALALAIRERTERLRQEGLFDPALKRPIPFLPARVAVVTSSTGAAIRDVCTVMRRRAPMVDIVVVPSQVQGDAAAATLIEGLGRAQRIPGVSCILLVRGGGAVEDLLAFQDEGLARAVRASSLPVVTGIGHEIDSSIADFAADVWAPTPSAAAELAVPDREDLLRTLGKRSRALRLGLTGCVSAKRETLSSGILRLARVSPELYVGTLGQDLDRLSARLDTSLVSAMRMRERELSRFAERLAACTPRELLSQGRTTISDLGRRLELDMMSRRHAMRLTIGKSRAALETLSPMRTLERGYSITMDRETGSLISTLGEVSGRQRIETRVRDGSFASTVDSRG